VDIEQFDPASRTLEYDHNIFNNNSADTRLYVKFYQDVLPDEARTEIEGRPCFKDATLVQIMTPGDKNNIVVREARPDDKARFPTHYARYQAGEKEQQSGYPLKEWPLATRAMIEELRYFGFTTVEAIAQANDQSIAKYPGLRELSRRAQNWLEARESTAPLDKLEAENKHLQEQVEAMQAQQQEMVKALAELKKEKVVA